MARDLGSALLGLASETGFPLIGVADPRILAFPAFGPDEALRIVPVMEPGAETESWALGLDVYIPQPSGTYVSLLQTGVGDGELFLRDIGDGTAGIGINGVYDGAVPFDAWVRIVVTFTREGGSTILRKFVDGSLVGVQDLGATDRWNIDPTAGLKLFNDNDGETASGAISSVFFTSEVPSAPEVAGLLATIPTPNAGGFFSAQPSGGAIEINFNNNDVAPRYGSAAVFLDGFGFQTPAQFGDSAVAFASQFGIDGPDSADVPILDYAAYAPAEGLWASIPALAGDLSSYTAVWDINVDALTGYQALLQTDASQDSDGEFFIRSDGGIGINGDYDGTVTAGDWHRIAITVEDRGDGTSTLSKYLNGVFLDSQAVGAARFTLDATTGFLLLTDNDGETGTGHLAHFGLSRQVLDAADIAALGGADGDGPFTETPAIPSTQLPAGSGTRSLTLTFDSSFRPYDGMTGEVMVSVDGAAFQSLLTLDTGNSGGNSSLSRVDETISIDFDVDSAAKDVAFGFNLRNAGNDWWWAIDNLALSDANGNLIFAENFNGLYGDLQAAVDENIGTPGWTGTPPEGWTTENSAGMPQGTTEWQGWSFATPEFWTSADGQDRSEFSKGVGVMAIADPDEWDDFNDGSQTGSDFDSTLTTRSIALEIPASPQTYQIGFDEYGATSEFGFDAAEIFDEETVAPRQDNIRDMLLRDDGTAVEIDLLAVFGADATDFEVTAVDGSIVGAVIDGKVLRLSGAALGHSDITVTAMVHGEIREENFRAIVAGANAYVFPIIPDTQDYTSDQTLGDNSFFRMTEWLLDQKDSLAIEHVIHVGDIVQYGAVSQWLIAEDAMERLDGEISYTVAVGNHDQQRPGFSSAFSFETDVDTYFTPEQVGATTAQGGGTYDGFDVGEDSFGNGNTYADSIRNHYTTFQTRDGTDWLVFSLEFGMPDDVLRWVGEVIEGHLDHRVIIDTHSWMGGDGRITPTTEALNTDNGGWGYAIRENPRNVNDGEDAWRELASKYPNVTFTFSGHNFMGGAETTVSYGAGGNPVHQIFVNYQNGAWAGPEGVGSNGGNGAMRLIVVDPDNDRITTHTKLVELDSYFNEFPDHEEVFEGVDLGAPEQIAIAKAGATMVVSGDGISAAVTLDPSATLGDITGARFEWFAADGEKLGETDGTPLEVDLQTGTNRLVLKVTDANGNISTDEKVVIVEAPDALLSETFDDGDAAGWGVPDAAAEPIFALGTDTGLGLPSIGGVAQIPVTLAFDSSFRPEDNQTGVVLVSFDGGATFAELDRLDTPGIGDGSLARANEALAYEVLAPNSADAIQFAWRMFEGANDWWWAIDNVAVSADDAVRETLLSEDFEGLTLDPFVSPSESGGDRTDWTDTPPAGWTRDNTTTPTGGPVEFEGWTFLDKTSWHATAGQQRDLFTRGAGTVAVADGDEYDDIGNIDPDLMNVFLTSPEIDLTGHDGSTLEISFDSSFRPFDTMTGALDVSLDGGATWSTLLTLDTATAGGDLARINDAITLAVDATGAASAAFRWGLTDAGNDWWWAVDNIEISAERRTATQLLAEDFDGLPLQNTVDETDPGRAVWTPTPPAGWVNALAPGMPQGATEFQGWTFVEQDFWIATAGDQERSAFTLASGNVAVADPDEWDDFNEGASGGDFDAMLKTPLIDLTPVGGGQEVGGEAGVLNVPALSGDEGLLLTPTASSGIIDSYSIVFDILLEETAATFSALYQTDVANSDDADIYFRNDGDTASIGISGDYDGALAYGEWGRVALVFETDDAGVQTLSKYLDGVFLDSQVVDGDVTDDSRWSINADQGLLLFSEPNGFTSDLFVNALHFTTDTLDAAAIAALGRVDVDGPVDAQNGAEAFQLNFDEALDSLDYGMATLEAVDLSGPADPGDIGSFLVKGSIFGNPDGEGEAALYQQSNGPDEVLIWKGEGADLWSDYVFDMVVEPADNDAFGAVFYYQDDANNYRLVLDQQNDTRALIKRADGVETVLATETASYRHFAMQDLRIGVMGGEITITLDDDLLFGGPVMDASPLAGGSVGVLSQNMDRVLFDNISVNPVDLAARALTAETHGKWATDLDGDGTATVDLTAAASLSAAGIAAYEWLVDGSVVATGATAALDLAPGETPVTLRVTDSTGATSEDQITVKVAGKGAVLAADDFEGSSLDSWTIVDEGTIEGPSNWHLSDGELVQASNIYSTQQGTGSAAYSVAGDGPYILRDGTYALWNDPEAMGWTDYALEATLKPGDDDGIGLLVRFTDAENYYKLESDAQTGLVMLTRHLEGRETILARGYAEYTEGEAQHWRVEVEGGTITPFIDGKPVFGTAIEDRTLSKGTVGLYAWGSEDLAFDDVVVTGIGEVGEPEPVYVTGTAGRDRLVGEDDVAEVIAGHGGRGDILSGGTGAGDEFYFDTIGNGTRDQARVTDFEAGVDSILLNEAANSVSLTSRYARIDAGAEHDMILVYGSFGSEADLNITVGTHDIEFA